MAEKKGSQPWKHLINYRKYMAMKEKEFCQLNYTSCHRRMTRKSFHVALGSRCGVLFVSR